MAAAAKTNVTSIQTAKGGGGRRGKAKSIQAESNSRGHKRSHVAKLNDKTLETARRHGMRWTDDDVEILVRCIDADEKTFDMALKLERTYYSACVARSHVGFAMRHQDVIFRTQAAIGKEKREAEMQARRDAAQARRDAAEAAKPTKRTTVRGKK